MVTLSSNILIFTIREYMPVSFSLLSSTTIPAFEEVSNEESDLILSGRIININRFILARYRFLLISTRQIRSDAIPSEVRSYLQAVWS